MMSVADLLMAMVAIATTTNAAYVDINKLGGNCKDKDGLVVELIRESQANEMLVFAHEDLQIVKPDSFDIEWICSELQNNQEFTQWDFDHWNTECGYDIHVTEADFQHICAEDVEDVLDAIDQSPGVCEGKPQGSLDEARAACAPDNFLAAYSKDPCGVMVAFWECQIKAAENNCEPGFENFIKIVAGKTVEARAPILQCTKDIEPRILALVTQGLSVLKSLPPPTPSPVEKK